MSEISCPNCSTMNREGAAFCRNCGAKLPAPVSPTVYSGPEPGAAVPPAPLVQPPLAGPAQPPLAAPVVPPYAGPVQPPRARPVQPPQVGPAQPAPSGAPSAGRSWLSISANLVALVCAFLFVALVSFALPVLSISGDLLDGELYKTSLREQDVYARFPDLFAEQMQVSQDSLAEEARLNLAGVTAADWKLVASELVTPQWMQAQVESLIDQVFAATAAGAAPPALKLSLAEVSQRLSGEAGFNIYKQIIATKRSCSLDDFFDIIDWIGQEPGVRLPICNIPPFLTEFAALLGGYENGDELIRDLLKQLPESIPAEVALSDLFSLRMDRVSGWVDSMTILAWISLLLGLGALLATLISPIVRTLKGWLLSWGICLAVAGGICLVESQVLPYTLGGLIVGAFSSSLAPSISKIILETGRSVTEAGANSLFWLSLALLLVGLGMAAVGALAWGMGKWRS